MMRWSQPQDYRGRRFPGRTGRPKKREVGLSRFKEEKRLVWPREGLRCNVGCDGVRRGSWETPWSGLCFKCLYSPPSPLLFLLVLQF